MKYLIILSLFVGLSFADSLEFVNELKIGFQNSFEAKSHHQIKLEDLNGTRRSCLLVSPLGPNITPSSPYLTGLFYLNFFEFFKKTRANLSFDSGNSVEGFMRKKTGAVYITTLKAPNIDLKKESRVFFQQNEQNEFVLEWTIEKSEFIKTQNKYGNLGFYAAWSVLEPSTHDQNRFVLFYGLCQ